MKQRPQSTRRRVYDVEDFYAGADSWDDDFEDVDDFEDPYSSVSPAKLLRLDSASVEAALQTATRWLNFLRGEADRGRSALLADSSGYPLEQALELFLEELRRGARTIITMKLPDGISQALGPFGLVASVRVGEDLDLSLFGGDEWETIHLDVLVTNPLMGWASEVSDDFQERLASLTGAPQLIQRLLEFAAKAGRAVTVAPLNEQLKEQYRKLGFIEDVLVDPTLMFWVPGGMSDIHRAGAGYAYEELAFAYGQ